MWEGFQSSRQSRAAYACTQGSSPDPPARRCLNSSCPQPKLAIKTTHSFFTSHTPCSNAQFSIFFPFEIFFITLPSSSHAPFLPVRRLLYLGTRIRWDIATSVTGQGQFLLIVVVHVRLHDYASFTMSPPRHSSFLLLSLVLRCCLLPLIMYFYHLFQSPAPAISIVLSLSVSMHVYSLFYLAL